MQQLQKCGCCFLFTQTKQNGILIMNKHMFGEVVLACSYLIQRS